MEIPLEIFHYLATYVFYVCNSYLFIYSLCNLNVNESTLNLKDN